MKQFTYDDIQSWNPCYDPIKYIPKDWKGTALDVLKMQDVSIEDRLWVVLRDECIDEIILHTFACNCAEKVLPIFEKRYPNDDRPRKAIEAKRKWIKKEVNDEQLDAARAAAGAAAWDTARDAARAAAWDTARDAARAAAWAAARAAARAAAGAAAGAAWDEFLQWEVDHLIKLLEDLDQ